MDDVEKLAKARKKQASLFATKPLRSPASVQVRWAVLRCGVVRAGLLGERCQAEAPLGRVAELDACPAAMPATKSSSSNACAAAGH